MIVIIKCLVEKVVVYTVCRKCRERELSWWRCVCGLISLAVFFLWGATRTMIVRVDWVVLGRPRVNPIDFLSLPFPLCVIYPLALTLHAWGWVRIMCIRVLKFGLVHKDLLVIVFVKRLHLNHRSEGNK